MLATAADLYYARLLRVLTILAAVFRALRYKATASRMPAIFFVFICHDSKYSFG